MNIIFLLLFALFSGGDHRCSIDPNGNCVGGLAADSGGGMDPNGGRIRVRGDNGSCVDPDGRCVRVRALDNGDGRSIIDPIGRVRAQGDRGAGLDPNG